MDIYRNVYERLDALPTEERIALLMEILPPQELFVRTDGFRCLIRTFGLRIFETASMLFEAGIPDDDPRTEVFRALRGGLVDEMIPNKLRSIAARERTVCKRVGAIQVWEGGKLAWWVPLAAASKFEEVVENLIRKFSDTRDKLLLEDYITLRLGAERRWSEASEAAYENMQKLDRTWQMSKVDFIQRSLTTFNAKFPDERAIQERVRMELVPIEKPLPETIERILEDVRQAAREKEEAEANRAREQMRLLEVERHLRREKILKLQEDRRARDRILREALDPQIQQAQQIVMQVQASLLRVARQITEAIANGADISPATRRSWNQRLKTMSVLASGNASLERALEDLTCLSNKKNGTSSKQLDATSRNVQIALAELESRASLEIRADQIWQLMREGKAEESLRRVASLRERLGEDLSEVEALWEMVIEIGARNESQIEEELVPVGSEI